MKEKNHKTRDVMLRLSIVPIDGVLLTRDVLDVKSGVGRCIPNYGYDVNFGTHPQ